MSNIRKSSDGRKRTRTMEYIDSQVDINDEDNSQNKTVHIGQHIHAQFDLETRPAAPKFSKRISEHSFLSRQMSDISLNRSINDPNKTLTEFKGRDHVLRVMKTTTTTKPVMEFKNPKLIQEILAKRQDTNKPVSDFALKYGLIDNNGRKSKSRQTSDIISDMTQQLEGLKANVIKRQTNSKFSESISATSSLLRIVRLEPASNQFLCYCQYIDDRPDLILFLDPNSEQTKTLDINDQIRIDDESPTRYDINIPNIGSVAMGITDIRKENQNIPEVDEMSQELVHTYDFNCLCNQCNPKNDIDQNLSPTFDLLSTFSPSKHSNTIVYGSFTDALMSKQIFDLRASIIIFNSDPIHHRYVFIVRDIVGNCLEIILNDLNGLQIEIQTKLYVFHQIEFIERIPSPKEANRWPYENYLPPKKLFSFKSIANRVTML